MNKELEDFLAEIYRLSYITRYSGVIKQHQESVAEHSFFVASIVVKLHELYDFDIGAALKMAIVHDWAEVYIGDITHSVKKAYPEIEEVVRECEKHAISRLSADAYECVNSYNKQDSVEAKIVALADVLQVLQFVNNEASLGSIVMGPIFHSAKYRINVLEEALNEFKR